MNINREEMKVSTKSQKNSLKSKDDGFVDKFIKTCASKFHQLHKIESKFKIKFNILRWTDNIGRFLEDLTTYF